jgi:HEAT repeat protein
MNKKILNFAIFAVIVAVIVGVTLSHSHHTRSLVEAMEGGNREARISAAYELVKTEQFLDAVAGESVEARTRTVQALEDWALSAKPNVVDPADKTKSFGPKDAVRQMVAFFKDPDKPVRDRILIAMVRSGAATNENLQEAVTGLKEGDAHIWGGCVTALQILGQKDDVAASKRVPREVLETLGKSDPVTAAHDLLTAKKPDVIAQLIPKVVDIMKREGGARSPGGDVLGGLTDQREESVAALRPLLADKDEGIRAAAADAMGKVGSKSAIPDLIAQINSGTAQVRRVSIGAVAAIADPTGEETLIQALNNQDTDNEARAQAAMGLGMLASPKAIDRLVLALSDFDLKVQAAAVSALIHAGDRAVPALILSLTNASQKTEGQSALRIRVVQALGGINSPAATAALINELKNSDAAVRKACAIALGHEGNSAAVEPLIALLADKDGAVAAEASNALTAVGEVGRSALANALSSENATVAYYASQALGRQGQGAVGAVKQESERSAPSRRWAVSALGRMGGPEAAAYLKQLSGSGDPDISKAALLELKRITSE